MNWKKVGIVISHEYSTRVRKKSFILTTLLTPLAMGLLICVPALIMLFSGKENRKVKVFDESGFVLPYLESTDRTVYEPAAEGESLELLKEHFDDLDYYALAGISPVDEKGEVSVVTYSKEPLNMELKNAINRSVSKAVEDRKLKQYDIRDLDSILAGVKTDIRLNAMTLTGDGKAKEDTVEVYMVLSYLMSFLIYMFVFMFGTMVMRSVIDEKSSRVVEVIVSSVKSVELMMGKIIGVALVALTQFFVWIALTLVVVTAVNTFAGPKLVQHPGDMEQVLAAVQDGRVGPENLNDTVLQAGDAPDMLRILTQIRDMNWLYIIGCFLVYFLLGYLLYASMFAAIGAAVDSEADTNQLQLPVTIPLIIGLFIMLHTFEHPGSTLSVWTSIIPWTSPMVMLARIPFGIVPAWQLLLSMVLLLLTFLATAWLSAKIYKVGILTYGKKSTFKDIFKWLKLKD